jgi:hypothetical protein
VCGTHFERSPAQIKSKHQGVYCSRKCHYAGRRIGLTGRVVVAPYVLVSEYDRQASGRKAATTRRERGNNRHSEATKERLRQATAAHTARIIDSGHVSKIEDEVAKELARVGIAFERQVGIRSPVTGQYAACADFVLSNGVVLEVNGTFWRADPRTFPHGPVRASQRRTADCYARKVAFLCEQSIPLVEVWEADLAESVENAVGLALVSAGIR